MLPRQGSRELRFRTDCRVLCINFFRLPTKPGIRLFFRRVSFNLEQLTLRDHLLANISKLTLLAVSSDPLFRFRIK